MTRQGTADHSTTVASSIRDAAESSCRESDSVSVSWRRQVLLIGACLGCFPVAFAFFVSLHRWRRFPDTYNGLANYEKALGNLAYILFFWFAFTRIFCRLSPLIRRTIEGAKVDRGRLRSSVHLLSGFICGYALLLLADWILQAHPRHHAHSPSSARTKYQSRAVYGKAWRKFCQDKMCWRRAILTLMGLSSRNMCHRLR